MERERVKQLGIEIDGLKEEMRLLQAQPRAPTREGRNQQRAQLRAKQDAMSAKLEERRQIIQLIKAERQPSPAMMARYHLRQQALAILPIIKPVVKLRDPVTEIFSEGEGYYLAPTPEQISYFDTELRTMTRFAFFSRNNFFPKAMNPYWIPKYNRLLLHNIPLSVHIIYHQFFNYYAGSNIISVGSGFGHIERLFSPFWTQDRNVYLIDPAPAEFIPRSKAVVRWPPDYAKVADLIAAHPEVTDNNGLFIMWAYPSSIPLNTPPPPNTPGPYDVEAIYRLRPRTILVCYEESGRAGSEEFFIGEWRVNYTSIARYTSEDVVEFLGIGKGGWVPKNAPFSDRLELLVRNDVPLLPVNPESGTYYDHQDIIKLQQIDPLAYAGLLDLFAFRDIN